MVKDLNKANDNLFATPSSAKPHGKYATGKNLEPSSCCSEC